MAKKSEQGFDTGSHFKISGGPIVLISCCKKKVDTNGAKISAEELYCSVLFQKALKYARKITFDNKIYILSAKHGLLRLTDKIATYNENMNDKSTDERKQWTKNVLDQMRKEGLDLANDTFVILAGMNYRQYLPDGMLPNVSGLKKTEMVYAECKGIGEILQKLNDLLK